MIRFLRAYLQITLNILIVFDAHLNFSQKLDFWKIITKKYKSINHSAIAHCTVKTMHQVQPRVKLRNI